MHRIPPQLEMLMNMPLPSKEEHFKHAWNQDDRPYNIFVKEDNNFVGAVVLVPDVFELHLCGGWGHVN